MRPGTEPALEGGDAIDPALLLTADASLDSGWAGWLAVDMWASVQQLSLVDLRDFLWALLNPRLRCCGTAYDQR